MSLFNLFFKKEFFDVIISNGVLHHTENPKLAFMELTKYLKKDGYVIIGLYHRYGRIFTKIRQFLIKVFGDSFKFLDKKNLPRQKFKKTYVANGIIDIYSVSFIKKNKMLLGSKVVPFITSPTTEVDNINDFKYLEYQVRKNKKILSKIFK